MKIVFVTTNPRKAKNARRSLRPFGISVKRIDIKFQEGRSEDPKIIATEKAREAYRILRQPVIVEDSGFFIRALGGFPMTHVKFSLKTLGITHIMKMLDGIDDRRAEWRMTVAYAENARSAKTFTFIERGEIARTIRPVKRAMMSNYWRIYIPTMLRGNTLALSEMTDRDRSVWQDYYKTHNHFVKFGRWFSRSNRNISDSP